MSKLALNSLTAAEAHAVSLIIEMLNERHLPEAQISRAEVAEKAEALYQRYLKKFVVREEVRGAIEDYLSEVKTPPQ